MMDKAYDSDEISSFIVSRKGEAYIPPRSNRNTSMDYDRETYKRRSVLENFFEKIKRHRRFGTRYGNLDEMCFSFLMLSITSTYLPNYF
jgi:transposase